MDKRYQVFVSSTYTDLQEERQAIMQTLMQMDCIPAGMELFPALDEAQFDFIKRIIDDCDYYILVIGGRYGSLSPAGIGYTEQEFDYAVSKGMKVIVFLHGDPGSIVAGKTEHDNDLRARLAAFRDKVQTGRLVKKWTNASELPGLVALNLPHTIKAYPAVGWVRATNAGSEDLLIQINDLRIENEMLKTRLHTNVESTPLISNIAGLDEDFILNGTYEDANGSEGYNWTFSWTWGDIFSALAPYLLESPTDNDVRVIMSRLVVPQRQPYYNPIVNENCFQGIKIHLMSLRLITVTRDAMRVGAPTIWELTTEGHSKMIELLTIRSEKKGYEQIN